ncbi:uncharacterized protein TNCV_1810291 [Trichonephila clavipes]|nr:uncharacterized protein TNCV_1810291 [Trichonephila clavipes]
MSGYRELYKELVPSQSLITDYLVKEKKITEVPEEALPCRSDDVILSSSDESDLAPIHKRREKWKELCKSIDAHTPNTKLWKLIKSLSTTQPQQEECNTIINDNGQISSDNKTSANLLGSYYQKTSKLTFNAMDKDTGNYARKLVHGCRNSEQGIPIFKELFTMQELNMALSTLDPSKSPGPDNIHGQMISRLSDWGKKSLLEIF